MKVIKAIIGWSLIRKMQAIFGTILLIGFIGAPDDLVSLGFGLFFLSQAVFNWGCASSSCASPATKTTKPFSSDEDVLVSYEEVRGK